MKTSGKVMAALVYTACFLSGAAALTFETLWFRLAGLTFGNSVWASSLVLGSFMTGVGLGSYLAARSGRNFKRPLFTYAILELIIGISGVALVFGFPYFNAILLPAFQALIDSSLLNVMRLAVGFLLFLIPATAMGATLPVLVQALSRRDGNYGALLGRLYGLNTLGATVGTILAGAVLIPSLGMRETGIIACVWDIAAAGLVFAALGRMPETVVKVDQPAAATGKANRILLVALLCGGALLALEVLWMRYLSLFLPETTLTFCIILAIVLAGIAAGGFIASITAQRQQATYIPHLALAAAILVVLSYVLTGNSAPDPSQRVPQGKIVELGMKLCFLVSMVSGMLFSACGKAVKEKIDSEIKGTGLLTLANTIGAAAGSIAAGFLLLPLLGMELSFFLIASLYILISLLALDRDCVRPSSRPKRSIPYLGLAAIAFLSIALYPFGYMRNYVIPTIAREYIKEGGRLDAMKEGKTETAIYIRSDLLDLPVAYRLMTNGHSMSGTNLRSLRYMRLYVYLPLALCPEAKDALLICYGVGTTASAMVDSSSLETIDIVDISENVLAISKEVNFYGDHHPLKDPRVRAMVEDGRFFLQSSKKKYDLITAEPPPPRLTGVCNIYSKEYFQLLRERLKEGGIATYWLPLYELHKSEAQAITSAFREVFPDATLWTGGGSDVMLVGTRNRNIRVTEQEFSSLWQDPLLRSKLEEIGLDQPEDLGALFLADTQDVDAWINKAPPLQDNYPGVMKWRGPDRLDDLVFLSPIYAQRFAESSFIEKHWPEDLRKRTLEQFVYQGYLNDYFDGNRGNYLTGLVRILTETNRRYAPLILMGIEPRYLKLLEKAGPNHPNQQAVHFLKAAQALADRKYADAARLFQELYTTNQGLQTTGLMIISTLLSGDVGTARQMLTQAQEAPRKMDPNILAQLEKIVKDHSKEPRN